MTINWVTARFPLLISCRWKGKRARASTSVPLCGSRVDVGYRHHLYAFSAVRRRVAPRSCRNLATWCRHRWLLLLTSPPLLSLLLLCVCRPLRSSVGGQLVAGEEGQEGWGGGGVLGLALGVAQPSWQLSLPLLLLLLVLLIGIWYYKSIVIIQIIFSIFPWACRTCLYVPTSPSCCLNTYQSFSIFGLSFCLLCF